MTVPGFSAVWRRVSENTSLSAEARLLYVILDGLKPAPDGTTLATHAQLAERLGVSPRTVRRRVAELAGADLLEWTRGGSGRPNRYRLLDVVPRGGQRRDRVLEVVAQPERKPLDLAGVVEAVVGQVPGVGDVTAAAHGAGALPDAPHRGLGIHRKDHGASTRQERAA